MIIPIQYLYYLVGFVLAVTALMTLRDGSNPRRFSAGLFWALYALVFLIGDLLPPAWVGAVAVVMALIAGFGGVMGGKHQPRTDAQYLESAKRLGNKLFVPALAIPLITMVGTLSAKHLVFGGTPLIDPKNSTLVSLGIGCVIALVLACKMTRETPAQGLREQGLHPQPLGAGSEQKAREEQRDEAERHHGRVHQRGRHRVVQPPAARGARHLHQCPPRARRHQHHHGQEEAQPVRRQQQVAPAPVLVHARQRLGGRFAAHRLHGDDGARRLGHPQLPSWPHCVQ